MSRISIKIDKSWRFCTSFILTPNAINFYPRDAKLAMMCYICVRVVTCPSPVGVQSKHLHGLGWFQHTAIGYPPLTLHCAGSEFKRICINKICPTL